MSAARTPVIDLRQYTTVPGRRDDLIDLFDRRFVSGQEATGIHVIGQFRDLDDPDRFVWLRGFASMTARGEALPRFYYGPVWTQHRDQANATMLDSDNALLLEPLHLGQRFPRNGGPRVDESASTLVAISVAHLASPVTAADRALAHHIRAVLDQMNAEVVAVLITHDEANNFPALPLRDEHVLVWITRFSDDDAYEQHRQQLASSNGWRAVLHRLAVRSSQLPIQQLRLRPTAGSQLR